MRSESKYFVTILCDAIARDDDLTYQKFIQKIQSLSQSASDYQIALSALSIAFNLVEYSKEFGFSLLLREKEL